MRRTLLTLLVGAVLAGVPADAHHSFARDYFEEKMVSVEGELVEFAYRSPHAWVYMMAQDENGQIQRVGGEWSNVRRLAQDGITKDTLKPGDQLVITGSPSRNPADYKLHVKGIYRSADGWRWGRRVN